MWPLPRKCFSFESVFTAPPVPQPRITTLLFFIDKNVSIKQENHAQQCAMTVGDH